LFEFHDANILPFEGSAGPLPSVRLTNLTWCKAVYVLGNPPANKFARLFVRHHHLLFGTLAADIVGTGEITTIPNSLSVVRRMVVISSVRSMPRG
jgi:hypothetical protein